jgi:hypothetical protein
MYVFTIEEITSIHFIESITQALQVLILG